MPDEVFLDSTHVKAHHCARGGKEGGCRSATVTTITPGDGGGVCPDPVKPALAAKIEALWAKIIDLTAQNAAVKDRIASLEEQVGDGSWRERRKVWRKLKKQNRRLRKLDRRIDGYKHKIERALTRMARRGQSWDFAALGAAFANTFDLPEMADGERDDKREARNEHRGDHRGDDHSGGANGGGQCTATATPTTTTTTVVTHYHYDDAGRLIAVSDATGQVMREHVALGAMPLAVIDYATGAPVVYAVHTDHQGTPRLMTDATGAEV